MNQLLKEPAPAKKRIGRIRFLLEFFIAAFLVKVGSAALGGLTGIGVVVPLTVFGLGFVLAIWATIRRLRDIRRSVWWVSVLIAPLPLGIVLGILMTLSGSGIINSIYMKTVGIAYMIVYVLFLGVLIFWPSAFPKAMKLAAMKGKQLSIEANNRESETIAEESVSDIEDRAFAQAAAELETNQRDPSVWARAYSNAEGDENRAKAYYIRYRAQRIGRS
jgi:uncharacterized membrane protein YhaH (DUF805 family)